MNKKVYINNAEYNTFFNTPNVDSDKLCAVFTHLRGNKNGNRRYSPKGKLKHFSLLREFTGMSRHAIETYVPILINIGVVTLNSDGGVSVMGFNSTFKKLRTSETRIIHIPIEMCKSFLKTAVSVGSVRIKTNIRKQNKQIDLKETQTKLLKKYVYQQQNPTKSILSKKETSAVGKIIERFGSINEFTKAYCEEVILSQNGFTNLNGGVDGRYFKKQLLASGFIESKIRTEKLTNAIQYPEYLKIKTTIISSVGNGVFWCPSDKCVYKYLASSLVWIK